ncbi:HotDog domain-containing protein [Lentinula raphanica]|uniref:HotDog domain-containing protein n=1 Tax=Lentinula raphanica TaxID=153919 RepID=A0AA38NZN1_9AGAR|nr:HotDog domain-containing protein [Lentinula raphanica]KAJ3833546.1 HotDog domain-containing protein [Lentinula raphanica]KAJ3967059.1 HotDog domain-containing protein [Lentinula raphanica]
MPPSSSDTTFTSPYTHNVVGGTASARIKRVIDDVIHTPSHNRQLKLFASSIMDSVVLIDVSIGSMAEEPSRLEGKVVIQTVVNEDMLNLANTVHGGCLAYFVDCCSSTALIALDLHHSDDYVLSVSQALNVVFHSPAALGETIRMVSMSVSSGGRSAAGRTEIWNDNHKRIMASGTHIKMMPSNPKTKL